MISTINDVEYDESTCIWLKLSCGGRDKTMYVGCIYFICLFNVDCVQECYEKHNSNGSKLIELM